MLKYVVQQGDSLSRISMKIWGTYFNYPQIYEVNMDILPDENTVLPGQVLNIPIIGGLSKAEIEDKIVKAGAGVIQQGLSFVPTAPATEPIRLMPRTSTSTAPAVRAALVPSSKKTNWNLILVVGGAAALGLIYFLGQRQKAA